MVNIHLRCAEQQAAAAGLPQPQAPLCGDWVLQGRCTFRDTCILRHPPPPSLPASKVAMAGEHPVAGRAPGGAAAGAQVAVRRRGKVLKRFRAGAFRRWLLDTFGQELLRCKKK